MAQVIGVETIQDGLVRTLKVRVWLRNKRDN
jgi:hypothetical protein